MYLVPCETPGDSVSERSLPPSNGLSSLMNQKGIGGKAMIYNDDFFWLHFQKCADAKIEILC